MDKPILLIKEEFIEDIINLINSSKLPLVLIEPILQDLLNDAKIGLKKQYKKEKAEYESYLKKCNENKTVDNIEKISE